MSRNQLEPERVILQDFRTVNAITGNKARLELEIMSRVQCSACDFDRVSKTSTDIRCPTCGGVGYVNSSKRLIIPGFVSREARRMDHNEPGITEKENLKIYIERTKYLLFKSLLKRKYRLRVNNEIYEILSREDAGIYRQDFILFICAKVEGV